MDLKDTLLRMFMRIATDGGDDILSNKAGIIIGRGYLRIVWGGRGPYIEFGEDMITREKVVKPGEAWRCQDGYRNKAFYEHWETKDECRTMIYRQRRKVPYADYLPNFYYVDPLLLYIGTRRIFDPDEEALQALMKARKVRS